MGFELFKSRKETIDQTRFAELLQDPSFKAAVEAVEAEMDFMAEEGENEGEEYVTHMEPGPDYALALKVARELLDSKNILVTESAIAHAIATRLDPDGSKGYTEVGL